MIAVRLKKKTIQRGKKIELAHPTTSVCVYGARLVGVRDGRDPLCSHGNLCGFAWYGFPGRRHGACHPAGGGDCFPLAWKFAGWGNRRGCDHCPQHWAFFEGWGS